MDIDEFNILFEHAMETITAENKEFFLLGDFNVDLLKIDDNKIEEFYNVTYTNLLVQHITLPTRIKGESATLIDNIFSNNLNFSHEVSGNLTVSISDHLPQILIVPKENIKVTKKQIIFKRDKNYDKVCLMTDFININWDTILNIDEANPIVCLNNFSRKANEVIDTYLPLIKLSNKELKIQVKPWIASEIRKSIKQCDKLLRKFIKIRNEELKEELYAKYKNIRNKIVSIIRASKKSQFQQYFIENGKDIKKNMEWHKKYHQYP